MNPLSLKDVNGEEMHTAGDTDISVDFTCLHCFSFHARVFEKLFSQNSEDVSMQRYLMAFPVICSHFNQCLHPLCPEEVSTVRLSRQCIRFL